MQDFGGFDHNQQSFRIVTHLEKRYPDFRGLNLSYETREGMVKHDPGFSREFAAQYQPELWPSLEAQIANLADEIAYTAHDLDDGLRSGLLAASSLPEVAILVRIAASRSIELTNLDELGRRILVRELLGELIEDAIAATDAALESAQINSPEQIRSQPQPLAGHTDSVWVERQGLRSFLYREFYFHPYVVRQAGKAHTVLSRLFESYTKNPRMLPRNIQTAAESEGLERAICDYLAGMTDRFALDEYARIFDPYTH
jgi:dGTPase